MSRRSRRRSLLAGLIAISLAGLAFLAWQMIEPGPTPDPVDRTSSGVLPSMENSASPDPRSDSAPDRSRGHVPVGSTAESRLPPGEAPRAKGDPVVLPKIRGLVVDPTGQGVAGAEVRCLGPDRSDPALTDENGVFHLVVKVGLLLREDRLPVAVSAPHHVPIPLLEIPRDREPRIVLRHGGSIAGHVVGRDGLAVPRFRLRLEHPGQGALSPEAFDAFREVEDLEGRFLLTGIPPGSYRLRAEVEVRPGIWSSGSSRTVQVEEDDRLEAVVIRLRPDLDLRGRITDGLTGEGIPGARIEWSRDAARCDRRLAAGERPRGDGAPVARSEADGSFALEGVPWDLEVLIVHHRGHVDRVFPFFAGSGSETSILIALDPGGIIRGTAWNDDSTPAPGAAITLDRSGASVPVQATSTGPDGSFEFTGLPPGSYMVSRLRPPPRGALSLPETVQSVPVFLAAGETILVDLGGGAPPGTRVFGTLFATSTRVDAVRMELQTLSCPSLGAEPAFPRVESTDAAGRFEFGGVPPGEHRLTASLPGGRVETEFTVRGAPEQRVDLMVPDSSLLLFVIEAGTDRGLEAFVTVGLPGAGDRHRRTDRHGRLQVRHLPPGDYEITALTRATLLGEAGEIHEVRRFRARVHDGRETRVDVSLEPGVSLEGLVQTANGEPAGKISIELRDERGQEAGMQIRDARDAAGGYRVLGLRPGRYTITARSPGFLPVTEPGVAITSDRINRWNAVLARQ